VSLPLRRVSDGPLSIRTVLVPELPGVQVVRYRSDGRLWRSVKDRFSVTMTYTGHAEWWGRGVVHTSTPRTIDLKQEGEVHRDLRRQGPCRFQSIAFEEALVTEAWKALGCSAPLHLRRLQLERECAEAAPFVRLHALLDEARTEPVEPLVLQTALTEALTALVGCFGDSEETPRHAWRPVRRAREALHAALREGVTLESLARQVGLSRFHLCRAFREEVGMPPYAYLTHLRVSRARRLLVRGLNPAEVALEVGLYDQSQLNRHFKRIVGVTPGQFARAVR
jgi:AraC-like DNA-binding protein